MRYRVLFTPELIVQVMETGAVISARCTEGLPEGARFLTASMEWGENHSFYYPCLIFKDDLPGDQQDIKLVYERIELPEGEPR